LRSKAIFPLISPTSFPSGSSTKVRVSGFEKPRIRVVNRN
jgi:hypothetical protein